MKLVKSPLFYFFLFLLGICAVWSLVLHTNSDKFTPWNYGFSLIYGSIFTSGAILGIANGLKFGMKSKVGKALIALGFGLFSWQVGLWIWVYYNIVLNLEVPFPSLADIFFLLTFYPLLIYGCFNLLQLYTPKIERHIKIESVVVVILSLVAICGFVIPPFIDPEAGIFSNFISIAFPVGDALLIAIALMALRIGGRKIHPSLLILVIGFFVQFAADIAFSYRTTQEIYWNGDIADVLYTLAGFTMSLGVLELVQSLSTKENIS